MTNLSALGASNAVIPIRTISGKRKVIDLSDLYAIGHPPTGASQTPASLNLTIGQYIALMPAEFQASATSFAYAQPVATDETGWIVLQTASNYLRDNYYINANHGNSNGKITLAGPHVVNRTVLFQHAGITVSGQGAPPWAGASVTYNGPDATVDAPVAIFDFMGFDEFFTLNFYGRQAAGGIAGVRAIVQSISFSGKGGAIDGPPSASGFIQGIRFRAFFQCVVKDCEFDNCLYDGIYITAPGFGATIQRNRFYGCHRDCIYLCGMSYNFSTELWIRNNEFGLAGRYAILLDMFNSTTATPIIEENSFEHVFSTSYYLANREWFVHGVAAGVCCIGADQMVWGKNYWEGIVAPTACDAALHLVECIPASIHDDNLENLFITTSDAGGARSTAGILYDDGKVNGSVPTNAITGITNASAAIVTMVSHPFADGDVVRFYNVNGMTEINGLAGTVTATGHGANAFAVNINSTAFGVYTTSGGGGRASSGHRFMDITDTRNYRVGYTGNFGDSAVLYLQNCASLNKVLFADGITVDGTVLSSFMNCGFQFWAVATTPASARNGRKVQPIMTPGAALYKSSGGIRVRFSNVRTDSRYYGAFDTYALSGDYVAAQTGTAWVANTPYSDTFANNYLFAAQQLIVPTDAHWTGYLYQCTVAGTSHVTTEPTWPTTVGSTVVDGTVTWTCVAGGAYLASENNRAEVMEFGMRRIQAFSNVAPTVGAFTQGDVVVNRGPDASGGTNPFVGWVCTASSTPGNAGTWHKYGATF